MITQALENTKATKEKLSVIGYLLNTAASAWFKFRIFLICYFVTFKLIKTMSYK